MRAPHELFNQSDRVYYLQADPDAPDKAILMHGIVDSTCRQSKPNPTIEVALFDAPLMPSVSPPELFSERTIIKAILERKEMLRKIDTSRFYMEDVVADPASRQELIGILADMREERGLNELIGTPEPQPASGEIGPPPTPQQQAGWLRAVAQLFD